MYLYILMLHAFFFSTFSIFTLHHRNRGLGKTVEVLSLIMLRQRPYVSLPEPYPGPEAPRLAIQCYCGDSSRDAELVVCMRCGVQQHVDCADYDPAIEEQFLCGLCQSVRPPLSVRTTLIVTPSVLKQQWQTEIHKHVKSSCKVMVYSGVHKGKGYISPARIAQYDVVLTTYDVLRSELVHLQCTDMSNRLRFPKRFPPVPTPLKCIQWWRVCLDEAQMVESEGSNVSIMAAQLQACNRWCVTGTPISNSIHDIAGLLCFLHAVPFDTTKYVVKVFNLKGKKMKRKKMERRKTRKWRR